MDSSASGGVTYNTYASGASRDYWKDIFRQSTDINLIENNLDKLDTYNCWYFLCANPVALPILEKHLHKINFNWLYENPHPDTRKLIDKWLYKAMTPRGKRLLSWLDPDEFINSINFISPDMTWEYLLEHCPNPHILENLKDEFYNKDDWTFLSKNPAAINILDQNRGKISWRNLSVNTAAIYLIERNPDTPDWWELSGNPAAIHILEANPDKINWWSLSSNPAAIHLLEKRPDKIQWCFLCLNPAAIHLIEEKPSEINWYSLFKNPGAMHIIKNKIISASGGLNKISSGSGGFNNEIIYNGSAVLDRQHIKDLYRYNPGIFEWIPIKDLHKAKIIKRILYNDLYNYIIEF